MAVLANATSDSAAEDGWHTARLIPVSGIRGQKDQEQRATSVLLAVMAAVPEFGHALLCQLGAPRGRIKAFTEVQFRNPDGKAVTPDGAIIVERGKKTWRALVEVKTGGAPLQADQVGRYLDVARDNGFDCVITISNHLTATVGDSPVTVDGRKLRRVRLYHLSWWRIVTEAVMQHRFRGIADPDQAWILGELIAYLDHDSAGASGFDDMGDQWIRVREAARDGTLRASDAEARAVAHKWEHFLDYLALGLSQELGRDVTPLRAKNLTESARVDAAVQRVASNREMTGSLRVPDAIGPLNIRVDLHARQVTTSVRVDAPADARAQTRVNWLLRQLRDAPPDLRVEAAFANVRETASQLLGEVRDDRKRLLYAGDPKREPRAFVIALNRPMGLKRGKGKGSLVGETRRQVLDFYALVVQDLKPWQPRPPQLTQTSEPPPTVEPNLLPIPMTQVAQPSLGAEHTAPYEGDHGPPHDHVPA